MWDKNVIQTNGGGYSDFTPLQGSGIHQGQRPEPWRGVKSGIHLHWSG